MKAIDLLKSRLAEYPSIAFSMEGDKVTVNPVTPGGFEVSLVEGDNETFVFYDGWHEHFSSAEEAVNCFVFGLSNRCRIRVARRGGKAYRWTLEAFEDGQWIPYGTTALLFFYFWRRADVIYLQNSHVDV